MMDREVADLHAAGHGWSVRTSEPEFDDSGEIRGFAEVEQEQIAPLSRPEYNRLVYQFAPVALLASLLVHVSHSLADWTALMVRTLVILRDEPMTMALEDALDRLRATLRNESEGEASNRWFARECEPVIYPEAEQADRVSHLLQEIPDRYDRAEAIAERMVINMFQPDANGRVDHGTDFAIFLKRKLTERNDRFERCLDWLGKQSSPRRIRLARVEWSKAYHLAEQASRRLRCSHNLWLTFRQWWLLDANCAIILGDDGPRASWRKMIPTLERMAIDEGNAAEATLKARAEAKAAAEIAEAQ